MSSRQQLPGLPLAAVFFLLSSSASVAADPVLVLKPGDHVAFIGNTLADRMQHDGWLETRIQAAFPQNNLVFRNLGYPGDELKNRVRSDNFGTPDEWLAKVQADVIFMFFGYNEALRGEEGLSQFRTDLVEVLDGILAQKYNGESAPRIVVCSPIGHEDLNSRNLPDGSKNNANLELYTRAMSEICRQKEIPFVDLFHPTLDLYESSNEPLTLNGIHLLENGNKAVAGIIVEQLFGGRASVNKPPDEWERLRSAVLDRNLHWFSRYRVIDEYNVFGGRSKLEWFGQSNADVMMREMEIFDVMTANRDARVWAVAAGGDLEVADDNLPEELVVKTNKPGPLEDEAFPYLSAEETKQTFKMGTGLDANVFASEEMFPEMVNPVQMAVDTDSRLFVSVWPSYPHWNPTEPRRDRILCLPDEDGDGVADECRIFADELNSVTGFEFWGGGMLVAAPPEIWFLKDTDGDDVADVKIRMLQGVSSADTHHSANALVIGTDGGLYWSRGIFNVASMETPTATYKSDKSGVHRFDPRTFEMSFYFPIGPNPHGHVIDQWGYHFVNDGTSGTGSYVNIGNGVDNRKWFEKRVRPVAATGILSSSMFPDSMQGNFLICNCIGFLGVLQHEVHYNGADITAKEIEPILVADDPNFRPTDLEIGGDGALYVSDWSNALIGHMQHNMRDPNRDNEHGRIFRVTAKGGKPLKPLKLKGQPIADVCQAFFAKENSARYRARLELSGRDTDDVVAEVERFAAGLDPKKRDEAQALLECLWVFEEHRVPNGKMAARVFQAEEPRVRAAAMRTLGSWGGKEAHASAVLMDAVRDESALVRAEGVKAAVKMGVSSGAAAVFEAATRATDSELDVVLAYAREQLKLTDYISQKIAARETLREPERAFAERYSSVDDLLKLPPAESVYTAILSRRESSASSLRSALDGIAKLRGQSSLPVLLDLVSERDESNSDLTSLAQLLTSTPASELRSARSRLESIALGSKTGQARQAAIAAAIIADGSAGDVYLAATQSKDGLKDFLNAVPLVVDDTLRSTLYDRVQSLIHSLPADLESESSGSAFQKSGILADYFYPSPSDVARTTLEKMAPSASAVVSSITPDVPHRQASDQFALRFTGNIRIPKSGSYTFFTKSDDGSRLYIGDSEVVNNDGLHGISEKGGKSIELAEGLHPITVTYFDNGGGEGLEVSWTGPGFEKQPISAEYFSVGGQETLHELAILSLQSIPGHEQAKVTELAGLMKAGRSRQAAVSTLSTIPVDAWPEQALKPMADNLIGYLTEMPAAYRTGTSALAATALSKSLASRLPTEEKESLLKQLENLDVRVIALGTVPARMIYDKEVLVVQAGRPVEFRFSNSDHMPHNFAIVQPGALQEIGEMAEATARDADAQQRHYIPKSTKVLLASRLLQPGETQALSFEAPTEPGVYPYVCTYPGHWRRMFGALYVVPDLNAYQSDPVAWLAANPLDVRDELLSMTGRNHEWTVAELTKPAETMMHGRSFEVGQQLFKVANCIACHQLNNEGRVFGPDLAKLDPKKQNAAYILQSMVEPSKDIEEKFRSYTFLLASGKTLTGMIVKQTDDEIHVVVDPLAKDQATVLRADDIDDRSESKVSLMPQGLLNRLTEEEILDLIAYVASGGNKETHAKQFGGHDHGHAH